MDVFCGYVCGCVGVRVCLLHSRHVKDAAHGLLQTHMWPIQRTLIWSFNFQNCRCGPHNTFSVWMCVARCLGMWVGVGLWLCLGISECLNVLGCVLNWMCLGVCVSMLYGLSGCLNMLGCWCECAWVCT